MANTGDIEKYNILQKSQANWSEICGIFTWDIIFLSVIAPFQNMIIRHRKSGETQCYIRPVIYRFLHGLICHGG